MHSAWKSEVHEVPMSVITRPFVPELEPGKVESLMETIQVSVVRNRLPGEGWEMSQYGNRST